MVILRFLRTVIGIPLIFLYMVPCALLILVSGETAFSEEVLRHWCRFMLRVAGATVTVRRLAALDPQKSYIFISNHTSHLDAPAILATTPTPMRFIAKKELSYIPFFGWAAKRMGHVFVDRKDSHGAAKAIRARIGRGLQSGVALFFFVEGTRATGDTLLPFKKGSAVAALDTQLDVVPIAVAGAREVLPPKGLGLFKPGPIALVFGEPLPIAGHSYQKRDLLVQEQRAAIERILVEARALIARAPARG